MTYTGIVHDGRIEVALPIDLPEGSRVYIIASPEIDEPTARRKANGWLIDHVGNMIMADNGILVQVSQALCWRFGAFITSLAHEPFGPIGYVEVNAHTGEILSNEQTVKRMYENGRHFKHPV